MNSHYNGPIPPVMPPPIIPIEADAFNTRLAKALKKGVAILIFCLVTPDGYIHGKPQTFDEFWNQY